MCNKEDGNEKNDMVVITLESIEERVKKNTLKNKKMSLLIG